MDKNLYFDFRNLKLSADFRFAGFPPDFIDENLNMWQQAKQQMDALEKGAIANPDEGRMVGHYWLRNPSLAPTEEISSAINEMIEHIKQFAESVSSGVISSPAGKFTDLLIIGIGGSALGPQFVTKALTKSSGDSLQAHFLDNTDPDGIDFTLSQIGKKLSTTLVLVISKSGGTPETRNGMIEAKHAFARQNLDFPKHAVAVTGEGSALYNLAQKEEWLDFFPMWDWVGGRTSETASVGLLPAALQGFDIEQMLKGAADMDQQTRSEDIRLNPAGLLALSWFHLTDGKGSKDMVILPYRDRLELFAKYLQQLIMESLGKEKNLNGDLVYQGISVYGNKGSTDQHAYVQQLREGVPNFFATFIEVLENRQGDSVEVDDDGMTSGDYLHGFMLGTRDALLEKGRHSITLTIESINANSVGQLIALYERAVGFYANLVGINAYHQPGVEAGKKAANAILGIRKSVINWLQQHPGVEISPLELAQYIDAPDREEWVFKILENLARNNPKSIKRNYSASPLEDRFSFIN